MKIRIIAFSDRGERLAGRLAEALPGEAARCGKPLSLAAWTERAFREADALVFVGACGIAVRAAAPYLRSKAEDPAVVVVDETAAFAVSLCSGHLGGANALVRRIAGICGAVPVITTATDRNGIFAVDEWARCQDFAVRNPEQIKGISARLLAGGTVRIRSGWPVRGEIPEGVRLTVTGGEPEDEGLPENGGEEGSVLLSLHPADREDVLHLVPRIAVLGVGCRKGITEEELEAAFRGFCEAAGICEEAFCLVCSIDRKAEEPGLLAFCRSRGLPLQTFPPEELQRTSGSVTPSSFVKQVTGVDNVCERSAILGSGGTLIRAKTAGGGITMAAAVKPFAPDWRTEA